MNLEQAKDVLAHIVEQRVRWGKLYDASDLGLGTLTDALVALSQGDVDAVKDLRESLTTARRQLTAANAREAKQKKKIAELEQEIVNLNRVIDRFSGE